MKSSGRLIKLSDRRRVFNRMNMKLEETIKQFVEDEHDISLAMKGSTQGYYNPKSCLVREARNGQYGNIYDFQESRFKMICQDYKLSYTELKTKLIEYQLK